MDNKIEQNVLDFMNKCSEEIGNQENDWSNISMWQRCTNVIESPIEQLLFCALYTIAKINGWNYAEPFYFGDKTLMQGISIIPQAEIGTYRVDFIVSYYTLTHSDNEQHKKEVIVECDSQQFHDRTEKERRYEKQRDRFLQTQGYKVFRFTGSEIVKNTLEVAQEIISFITDVPTTEIQTDSNWQK